MIKENEYSDSHRVFHPPKTEKIQEQGTRRETAIASSPSLQHPNDTYTVRSGTNHLTLDKKRTKYTNFSSVIISKESIPKLSNNSKVNWT